MKLNDVAGPVLLVIAAVASVSSSQATPSASPAQVFDFDSAGFEHCTVLFNWTAQELTDMCGKPEAIVPDARAPKNQCYIYRSVAHSLRATDLSPPFFAVCFRPAARDSGSSAPAPSPYDPNPADEPPTRSSRKVTAGTPVVTAVYGLSEAPTQPKTPPTP